MFAREPSNSKKALFGFLKIRRVERQPINGRHNAALCLIKLGHRPPEGGQGRIQSTLGGGHCPLYPAHRVAHRALGPVISQRLIGFDNIGTDPLCRLHKTALRIQLRLLARLRVQCIQLGHRVAQIVFLSAHRSHGGLGSLQRFACRPPRGPCATHSGARRLQPAKSIQNIAVSAWVQKAAVVMLAMQFHQRIRQRAQHLARAPPVINPSRFSPLRRVDPPQDQLIPARQARLLQHRMCGVVRTQIKPRRDLALRRALAHQIRTPAPAQHKAERVQQDRFTRPCLAGQHVQAGLERQFQPVNDQHVRDIKAA